MAMIIAIANQKGGVAKTTTTQNLGVALALMGKRVLVVDMDSQASLTIAVGMEPVEHAEHCIVQLLTPEGSGHRDAADCIARTPDGHLAVIPSIIDLANLEWQLFSRINRESIFKRAIAPVMDRYDYILLDCPPSLSLLTINALSCANGVLVPSTTEYLSYRGLANLEDTIADVQEMINPSLRLLGTVATKHERTTRNRQVLELMLDRGDLLAVVKKRAEALSGIYDGRSVVEQSPYSDISLAYKGLAKMIAEDEYTPLSSWRWA